MSRGWGKPKFKEPIAVVMRRNRANLSALVPDDRRAKFDADFPESRLPPLPVKRVVTRVTPANELEGATLAAVSELLAIHPRVAVAVRMNTGMVQNASGAPVWFHRFLRYPEPLKMADFIGWLVDGRTFAFEAKRANWQRPSDDRERKQAAFLETIKKTGGIAAFVTSADQVHALLA